MLKLKSVAIAGAMIMTCVPVQAAVTTFSGSGVLERQSGTLPSSGLTPIGSPFAFSFAFDFAEAVPYEQSADESIFDLQVSNFSASLGGYALPLASEPMYIPFVLISRGFSFFGQPFSEPSIIYSFYFSSPLVDNGSSPTPFLVSNGSRIFLEISAVFRAEDDQRVLGLGDVIDPSSAADRSFSYSVRDVMTRKRGFLQGSYDGAFAQSTSVPETSTWAMMIVGFGAAGTMLRRRRATGTSIRCL